MRAVISEQQKESSLKEVYLEAGKNVSHCSQSLATVRKVLFQNVALCPTRTDVKKCRG